MRHLTYLAVLAGCLAGALWLEPVLRVGVLRQWRRLLLTVMPVALVFLAWDVAAIAAHHWRYDPAQTVGLVLPGRLPVEEVLFFLVVPVCAVLGFEAVRTVLARRRTTRRRTVPGRSVRGGDVRGGDVPSGSVRREDRREPGWRPR